LEKKKKEANVVWKVAAGWYGELAPGGGKGCCVHWWKIVTAPIQKKAIYRLNGKGKTAIDVGRNGIGCRNHSQY